MTREAFIFIPGLSKLEKGKALDQLIKGLTNSQDIAQMSEPADVTIDGHLGKKIQANYFNGESKTLDFFEAYWNDLTYSLEENNTFKKLAKATGIIFYWFFSKVWRGILGSKVMTLSAVGTGLTIVFWYYGIIMLALIALKSEPALMGSEFLKPKVEMLSQIGVAGQELTLWLAVSLLMTLVPIDAMVNKLYFTKEFLQRNELKHAARRRVGEVVSEVVRSGQYNRITLVGYSFGVVVATDFLSNYQIPSGAKVRFITLGGSLDLLKHRSDWLKNELDTCQHNAVISEWIDFYSQKDWLATKTPAIKSTCPVKPNSQEVADSVPWGDRFTGKVHETYFSNSLVMNTLLQPVNTPVPPVLQA